MTFPELLSLAKLNYWFREKHYHRVQSGCETELLKKTNDPVLSFYKSFSLIMQGDKIQEGMRELETLKDLADVNLGATMALIYAHKKAKNIDREAVIELDAKLKEERRQAGEKGLYLGAVFLFHTQRIDKAREYADRMLKLNSRFPEGLILKGWIELSSGREAMSKKAHRYFDEVLGLISTPDLDALLGKAKCCEMRQELNSALDCINRAVVTYGKITPPYIEKMKLTLASQDWDQLSDLTTRVINIDAGCVQAHALNILQQLCRNSVYSETADLIKDLIQILEREEPSSSSLHFYYASLFSKICGRNALVLQQLFHLAERAVTFDDSNAEYVNELGRQMLLQDRVRDSIKCFRSAMRLDEGSVSVLTGLIHAQLLDGQVDEAAQQIEFLKEVEQTVGNSAELFYLTAMLGIKRGSSQEQIIKLLDQATEAHFSQFRGMSVSLDYFIKLNPDFLILLTKAYLMFTPQQPPQTGQKPDIKLKHCIMLLDPLLRLLPGLIQAGYLMGKVKFLSGQIESAQSILQKCLDQDNTYSDAHILMAQIYLEFGQYKKASQSLEVGLSYNFEVREHPLYHLICARIAKKQENYEEAVQNLQTAIKLPGVKSNSSSSGNKRSNFQISLKDRVSVFLELADGHRQLNNQHEAAKIMQDALNEFAGTPEEVRISIGNADLSLARGDIEGALSLLHTITHDQPYYVEAREKMASIYLNQRNDKKLYASCYRDMVSKNPTPQTHLLLGDAYMNILEPELAIEVYETAIKKNPRDANLASKIGQALVKTHNYGKAITYYEASLKSGGSSSLRHDLAELLLRLHQFDKAEKVLRQSLETETQDANLESLISQTRSYLLLARIQFKKNQLENSHSLLKQAKALQLRVLQRTQLEHPDDVTNQQNVASSICCEMAEHLKVQKMYQEAIQLYKEALSFTENSPKVILDLAHLLLLVEELDECQLQCMNLLKLDEENDSATMMMADLMFRKNDYEQAMFHFQQILSRQPDHYGALSRSIELLRRAGKLDSVPALLEKAEVASGRASIDPGFNYCKGLLQWYSGNPTGALKLFNIARQDSDWGQKAMYNMIEICLNPDNQTIGGEVFDSVDHDLGISQEKVLPTNDQMALRTAEKLIKDMRRKPGDMRPQLFDNMLLMMSSKSKGNLERALTGFLDILKIEKDNIGAIYGSAATYMMMKNVPRAKNQLKPLAKANWNMEEAEDLEKCWLLLADIYINSGKLDVAGEMLKRCLDYNKSCCKAYEYKGYISEKESAYGDAAEFYSLAWIYGQKNSPSIGYKLAFNYLKAKNFVDAIDIAHHVLKSHPQYPKIRKDVLEKARNQIRI